MVTLRIRSRVEGRGSRASAGARRSTLGARLLALVLLLGALDATASGFYLHNRRMASRPPPPTGSGDACGSCTNENYNATGYQIAGWQESGGTVNEDYTTSPAPLEGAQSLLLLNTGFDAVYSYIVMPGGSEGYGRFSFVLTNAVVNGLTIFSVSDNTSAHQFRLIINSSQLRVQAGVTTANTVTALSPGQKYYCWVHAKTGSGNAVMDVGFSTSKTQVTNGDGFAQFTTGTVTVTLSQWAFLAGDLAFAGSMGGVIIDEVSFSPNPIGDFQ